MARFGATIAEASGVGHRARGRCRLLRRIFASLPDHKTRERLEVPQLAHSKSALKRWRQNERHRERNKPVRTSARTAVKKARAAADGDPDEARAAVAEASSILDRAAKRRVIHPNAASRHKSRLMRRINRASAPAAAEATPAKGTRKASTKGTAKAKAPAKPRASRAKAKS